MTSNQTALVLGATGGIGGEIASTLLARGWTVRGLNRDPASAAARGGNAKRIQWIAGDAMNPQDVITAARDVSIIVHAVNPPGYRNWGQLVLPMIDNTIAAAKATGARILLPGTVYNYGPDAFPTLRESSPQHPCSKKGAIRAEMERRLRQASERDGVRVLIVRAGDFFGSHAGNNWFSQGLVKPGKAVRTILYPGKSATGHAWAYLPDLAETMMRLVEQESRLSSFETFHFGGHWDADGTAMVGAIRRTSGHADAPVRKFPWPLVWLASPFVPLFRETLEMRYLWREPLRLDNSRLVDFLGGEPHTPLDTAVRNTLAGLGSV
jgi:nucleoside-diphosphate-sugar epimerase